MTWIAWIPDILKLARSSAAVRYVSGTRYIGRVTCRGTAQIVHIGCTTFHKYCIFFLLWGLNRSVWVTVMLCFQPWIFIIYCLWFYKTICNSLVQIKISFLWDMWCACIYVCMYVEYTVYLRCICGMSFSYFKLRKIVIGGLCQNQTENIAWLQKYYTLYLNLIMFYSVHFIFNFHIYFMGYEKSREKLSKIGFHCWRYRMSNFAVSVVYDDQS